MKRKGTWIALAILVVVLVAVFFYLNQRARALSPPDTETLTTGGMSVEVKYNRPSVRGRLIFGTETQQALQPFGAYWRLGANEATRITFNRNILFNGTSVRAGNYRMYAVPGPDTFEIVLNSEEGNSASSQPNPENDVLRTAIPVQRLQVPTETLTISLAPSGPGMDMIIEWSSVRLIVPLRIDH